MIFEHLKYIQGKVEITPTYSSEKGQEYNLCVPLDPFFDKHLFDDFGKVIQETTEEINLLSSKKSKKDIKTFQDMERIIDELPQLRRKENEAKKHLEIVEGLTSIVKKNNLFELMKVENDLFSSEKANDAFELVRQIVLNNEVRKSDKFRIVLLFALKYIKNIEKIDILCNDLIGCDVEEVRTVKSRGFG